MIATAIEAAAQFEELHDAAFAPDDTRDVLHLRDQRDPLACDRALLRLRFAQAAAINAAKPRVEPVTSA